MILLFIRPNLRDEFFGGLEGTGKYVRLRRYAQVVKKFILELEIRDALRNRVRGTLKIERNLAEPGFACGLVPRSASHCRQPFGIRRPNCVMQYNQAAAISYEGVNC